MGKLDELMDEINREEAIIAFQRKLVPIDHDEIARLLKSYVSKKEQFSKIVREMNDNYLGPV